MRPIKFIIRLPRPTWTSIFLILGIILLTTISALFAFRNTLLQFMIKRKIDFFLTTHPGVTAYIGDSRFETLNCILLEEINLQSKNHNLSLMLGKCSMQLTLKDLFMRRLQPRHLELSDLKIDMRNQQDHLEPSKKDQKFALRPNAENVPDYGEKIADLIDFLFQRIPDSLTINRLTFSTDVDSNRQSYHISRLSISGPDFEVPIRIEIGKQSFSWLLKGQLNRKSRLFSFRLEPTPPDFKIRLPYIDLRWNTNISFSSASMTLNFAEINRKPHTFKGSMTISDLNLSHPKIADQEVNINQAALDFNLHIVQNSFELDKPSRITLNRLSFSPYIRFWTAPEKKLILKIDEQNIQAGDFFLSLPPGLFTCLTGIEVNGCFDYHLNFAVDFSRPEEISLDAEINERELAINRFGAVDFRTVNGPFEYEVFEKGEPIRTIHVGPDNPDFCPLDRISPYLRNAVLICEDGGFFHHRGFLVEPFKNSITANLQQGRFVRGGSTISMQLVKNLFLSRHKTIARKLEEMIITWLIEENHLISKERMFEIYLNIIEWGPGIYGVSEAARYYFDKEASDLTLAESIFMASIVPRPRRFMVAFDPEQKFKEWMIPFYKDVSEKMRQREMISQTDYDHLVPEVNLTGPARLRLKGRQPVDLTTPENPSQNEGD